MINLILQNILKVCRILNQKDYIILFLKLFMAEEFKITEDSKRKGDEADIEFRNWLDKHSIPYFYIKQDLECFSKALDDVFSGKRPDFMILLPNFGFIFVDVKNRSLHPTYRNYPRDTAETKNILRCREDLTCKFGMPYLIENMIIKLGFGFLFQKLWNQECQNIIRANPIKNFMLFLSRNLYKSLMLILLINYLLIVLRHNFLFK